MNAPARLSSFLGIVLALSASAFSQTPFQRAPDPWPPPGVHFQSEAGLTPPRIVREFGPQYTSEAMRAGIEGSVCLEAVVDVNGRVGAIHIAHSLDELNGLDEQAVRTVEKWQFTPGSKDGEAVPVLVTVKMAFTMGKKKPSLRDSC
jgi:protein TonB